jgi:hypothetical protein
VWPLLCHWQLLERQLLLLLWLLLRLSLCQLGVLLVLLVLLHAPPGLQQEQHMGRGEQTWGGGTGGAGMHQQGLWQEL